MIAFTCTCGTLFTVTDDKAGKKTTCPRCKTKLVVPHPLPPHDTSARTRPPAKVIVVLAGFFLAGLGVIGLLAYLLTPNPSRPEVERRLREKLPPHYESFKVESYDRDTGHIKFALSYTERGNIMPTEYEVIRYDAGGAGWRVQVTGRRRQWDKPATRWLMIDAVFDGRGKVLEQENLTAAGPGEEAMFEERARAIALAVHGAF